MYDLIIVGAGPVGLSLCLALKDSPLKIALIEKHAPNNNKLQHDERRLVLNLNSQIFFKQYKLWSLLENDAISINKIDISRYRQLCKVRLKANKHNLSAFGYLVRMGSLYQALLQCSKSDNITYYYNNGVEHIETQLRKVRISCSNGEQLAAKLIIAADGGNSCTRNLLGIGKSIYDYREIAINCIVKHEISNKDYVSFERFTPIGIIALLPIDLHQSILILSTKEGVGIINEKSLLTLLQRYFGFALGKFTEIKNMHRFPLLKINADNIITERGVCIGNAANQLYPVAAQNFNLGVRDVQVLSQLILNNIHKFDNNCAELLHKYSILRRFDQKLTDNTTHFLATYFMQNSLLIKFLSKIGFWALDSSFLLQEIFCQHAMGLAYDKA